MAKIDANQVKQYNMKLQDCKNRASKLTTEIEVRSAELARTCAELQQSLGREVNPDNIREVYESYVAKIQQDLEHGNRILAKIEQEERMIAEGNGGNNGRAVENVQSSSTGAGTGVAAGSNDGFGVYGNNANVTGANAGTGIGANVFNQYNSNSDSDSNSVPKGAVKLNSASNPFIAMGQNAFAGSAAVGGVKIPNLFPNNGSNGSNAGSGISLGGFDNDDGDELHLI